MKNRKDHLLPFKTLRLTEGCVVSNITLLVNSLDDFTEYMYYLCREPSLEKPEKMMFLSVTDRNRIVFETILPLLNDWSRFDKQNFLNRGSFLYDGFLLFASYPIGKNQDKIFHHGTPLIVCKAEI